MPAFACQEYAEKHTAMRSFLRGFLTVHDRIEGVEVDVQKRQYRGMVVVRHPEQIIGLTHWKNTYEEARVAVGRMWKRKRIGRRLGPCFLAVVIKVVGQ